MEVEAVQLRQSARVLICTTHAANMSTYSRSPTSSTGTQFIINNDSYLLYFLKRPYTSPLSNGAAADLNYSPRHDPHTKNRRSTAFMLDALLSEAAAVRFRTVRYDSFAAARKSRTPSHRQEIDMVIANTTRVVPRDHDVEISTPQLCFRAGNSRLKHRQIEHRRS